MFGSALPLLSVKDRLRAVVNEKDCSRDYGHMLTYSTACNWLPKNRQHMMIVYMYLVIGKMTQDFGIFNESKSCQFKH